MIGRYRLVLKALLAPVQTATLGVFQRWGLLSPTLLPGSCLSSRLDPLLLCSLPHAHTCTA